MRFRRRHRDFPELNTTSTADISFMLLVFFLVTSSMDSDKGLGRKLAPLDEQQQEMVDVNRSDVLQIRIDDQQQEMVDVNRSDVLQIRIDERDSLYCDDEAVTLMQLQQQVESFVASRQTDRYIIAVQTARTTSYDAYFEMQNAVIAAYRTLRDKMARQKFGHSFAQCTEEEREIIRQRYPQRISEGMGSEE